MRKIIFEMAVSLDGYIESSDGALDWVVACSEYKGATALAKRFDTLFYGRRAYERTGIPNPAGTAQHDHETLTAMRKYVFSKSVKHVAGNGMMVNGNLAAEVRRLRDEDGKDILFRGGADILRTFIAHDFIDEYRLCLQPVILGGGKTLFSDMRDRIDMQLVDVAKLPSGAVLLRYEPKRKAKSDDRGF